MRAIRALICVASAAIFLALATKIALGRLKRSNFSGSSDKFGRGVLRSSSDNGTVRVDPATALSRVEERGNHSEFGTQSDPSLPLVVIGENNTRQLKTKTAPSASPVTISRSQNSTAPEKLP